jgi:hypothetical protein
VRSHPSSLRRVAAPFFPNPGSPGTSRAPGPPACCPYTGSSVASLPALPLSNPPPCDFAFSVLCALVEIPRISPGFRALKSPPQVPVGIWRVRAFFLPFLLHSPQVAQAAVCRSSSRSSPQAERGARSRAGWSPRAGEAPRGRRLPQPSQPVASGPPCTRCCPQCRGCAGSPEGRRKLQPPQPAQGLLPATTCEGPLWGCPTQGEELALTRGREIPASFCHSPPPRE